MYHFVKVLSLRENKEERDHFHQCLEQFTSILAMKMDEILDSINSDFKALEKAYLIAKIFYQANILELAPQLKNNEKIKPWIMFFIRIVEYDCPKDLCSPTDVTEIIDQNN
jgi:hypothetical protein